MATISNAADASFGSSFTLSESSTLFSPLPPMYNTLSAEARARGVRSDRKIGDTVGAVPVRDPAAATTTAPASRKRLFKGRTEAPRPIFPAAVHHLTADCTWTNPHVELMDPADADVDKPTLLSRKSSASLSSGVSESRRRRRRSSAASFGGLPTPARLARERHDKVMSVRKVARVLGKEAMSAATESVLSARPRGEVPEEAEA